MNPATHRRLPPPLLGILLYAGIARIAYLLYYRAYDPLYGYLLHDARLYHEWAVGLAAGTIRGAGAFGANWVWESAAFYQAPGYPYWLGLVYRLFGAQPLAAYVAQTLAGLLAIVLIHRVAVRAHGSSAGLAAAALAALYGTFPFYETKLLSASTAVLLVALVLERLQAADAAAGDTSWLAAGLAAGLACVTRPNQLLLIPLVVVWIVFDRRRTRGCRTRRAAMFLAAVVAVVGVVPLQNYLRSGELVALSTNGGLTFYHGNNHAAEGWFAAPGMSGKVARQREESRRLAEGELRRALSDSDVSAYWLERGIDFIRNNPRRYVRLEARKAFLALDNYEHGLEYNLQLDSNPLRRLLPLPFAAILAFAVLRAFKRRRIARAETPVLIVLTVQLVTLLLFYAAGRYRLPLTVPLLVLAGSGVVVAWARIRAGWRQALGPLVVAGLLAAISLARLDAARYRELSAFSAADIGLAFHESERYEESVAAYRNATERNPAYAWAYLDAARPLRGLGRNEDAESSIERAIALSRAGTNLQAQRCLVEALFELGDLRLALRRPEAAAAAFAEVFRLDPTHAAAGSNLIGCYLTLGRREAAVAAWREMQRRGLRAQADLEAWMQRNVGP